MFIEAVVLIPSFINARLDMTFSILFFLFLMIQVLFVCFLMFLAYNVFSFIISKLKLPFKKFISLFLLMVSSCFYMISNFNVNNLLESYTSFDYNLSYFIVPLFLKSVRRLGFSDANILIISLVYLAVLILFSLSLFIIGNFTRKKFFKIFEFCPNA